MSVLSTLQNHTIEARKRNGLAESDTRISVAVSKGRFQIQSIIPIKGKPPEISALTGWLNFDQLCDRLGTIQCEC